MAAQEDYTAYLAHICKDETGRGVGPWPWHEGSHLRLELCSSGCDMARPGGSSNYQSADLMPILSEMGFSDMVAASSHRQRRGIDWCFKALRADSQLDCAREFVVLRLLVEVPLFRRLQTVLKTTLRRAPSAVFLATRPR